MLERLQTLKADFYRALNYFHLKVPVKVLFDTNVFDSILDKNIESRILAKKGDISIYTTYVQKNEIEATTNLGRRLALQAILATLNPEFLYPEAVMGGGNTKRGYTGMVMGEFKLGTGLGVLESLLSPPTTSNPLGRKLADLLTLRASHDEGMDYLVTDNIGDFKAGWELLKKKENTRLTLLSVSDFIAQILQSTNDSNQEL